MYVYSLIYCSRDNNTRIIYCYPELTRRRGKKCPLGGVPFRALTCFKLLTLLSRSYQLLFFFSACSFPFKLFTSTFLLTLSFTPHLILYLLFGPDRSRYSHTSHQSYHALIFTIFHWLLPCSSRSSWTISFSPSIQLHLPTCLLPSCLQTLTLLPIPQPSTQIPIQSRSWVTLRMLVLVLVVLVLSLPTTMVTAPPLALPSPSSSSRRLK